MTAAEHAKVWRKAAQSRFLQSKNPAAKAAWHLAYAMAKAYEEYDREQAAKEQEGKEQR